MIEHVYVRHEDGSFNDLRPYNPRAIAPQAEEPPQKHHRRFKTTRTNGTENFLAVFSRHFAFISRKNAREESAPAIPANRPRPRQHEISTAHLQIVFLLGFILATSAPAAAQNLLPRPNLAPNPNQSRAFLDRRSSASASTNLSRSITMVRASFSRQLPTLAGAYRNSGFATILPLPEQVATLFASKSAIPLAAFGKGRFGLEGFGSTLHMSNVELGPSGAGGLLDYRAPRHYQLSDPRGLDSYGLSIKLRLGRDSQITSPAEFWHHVSQLFDEIR
jgi:hypothetical protein